MPRYRQDVNPAANIAEDGDNGWTGVNCLLDPGLLAPGVCADARNKRFARGQAETRPGCRTPVQFNPAGLAWGVTFYGSGTFADPGGREWLLIATEAGVYRCRHDVGPTSLILLEEGETISGPVELVQTFSTVILFRGSEQDPLEWDGTLTGRFRPIPDPSAVVSFLERIPRAEYGVVMAGRAFVPTGRDQVGVSDLEDYTSWDSALNTFRLNAGEDDRTVALVPFRRNSLVVLKRRTMYRLANVEGDLSQVAAEVINSEIGCVARRTVAPVGGDLIWLSSEGVMRLSETLDDSMQTQEVAMSEPISPWIERINWREVETSCARVHGRYYFLAVPMDGSPRPNAMLVYDLVTRQWQGMDTFPDGLYLDRLHTVEYDGGLRRLVSIDLDGMIVVHGLGRYDEIDGQRHGIQDLLRTRGYTGQEGKDEVKHWHHVNVEVSTYAPSVEIDAIVDGVNETRAVGLITRDRTKYNTHGKGLHDLTSGSTHGAAQRQDYQVLSSDGIMPDAALYPEREQTVQAGYTLRDTGRWVQIEIRNTTGSCTVRMCKVQGVRKLHNGRIYG